MSKETGGPAFPNITPDMPVEGHPGMSLRDYFAAKAMQGLLMEDFARSVSYPDKCAAQAYVMADAMLLARSNDK